MWTPKQQKEYTALRAAADKITLVTDSKYTANCMQKRNEYMVDQSSLVIAVTDGRAGGTMSTVNYAKRQGKETVILRP